MRTIDGEEELLALLRVALADDPDGDFFVFTVNRPSALAPDSFGRRAWRVNIDALLAGRTFARLRVDLVERLDEIADATEAISIPAHIGGVGFAAAHVIAVDIAQHAAEKFHALCVSYSDGRLNTRVKDLLDVALMAEAGQLPHPNLPFRLRAVFAARDGRDPPPTLPPPPASWRADYALLASTTRAGITDLDAAFHLACALFERNEST